ncbi:hypothetical protein SASPL_112453 [Salvia splendens]|uniref:Cyclopropane-fatty-acyl-phospholipid synthase n=1 Tax=Salvia splendens TaxID=180675 RepID=A0A8X9A485_SALSN|nr:hypothetical protein SASPL_112453 [Salvia splendens]
MLIFLEPLLRLTLSYSAFPESLCIRRGFEWGTRNGLSSLFDQKKNMLNPWFRKMIREIINFRDNSSLYIEELNNNPDIDRNETLGSFVQSRGYSELFQKAFLIPVCAAIWSYSSAAMTFSAYLTLSFLCNQDILELLGLTKQLAPKWLSQSYVDGIKKELESRGCQVKTSSEIYSVLTNDKGNDIFLHHDENLMPKVRGAWSSRNVLGDSNDNACITYWLNNAQNISEPTVPIFASLNPPYTPKDTSFKSSTRHPIPSVAASRALSNLNDIQGKRGLWFCGAYQGYGFPEDGAGILAANSMLRKHYTYSNNPTCMVPSCLETGACFVVTRFLQRFIATGCLIFLEEGGKIFTFEGTRTKSNLKVIVRVHKPQFYWKVATEADLGFADAYINGDISFVDANEGLLNFLLLIIRNAEINACAELNKERKRWTPFLYTSIAANAKKFINLVSRRNTMIQARRNISRHYDLSNELFSLFLDETMTYSCAIFQNPLEDLKNAQLRKVHTWIEKARINKDHHILEIGCGWGSLAVEVVKKTGCKYTGITLSESQLQYIEAKVKEAGLQDQIEVLLCDYRQLPKNYRYDRIISCGMIEHVGHDYMEEFFKCCESSLADNGILVLQAMAAASRLSVVHLEEIGYHYYHTLRSWRHNFLQNRSKIHGLGFDDKFIRTWEYYFDYCAAGFKYCVIGDFQIVLNRPGDVAAFGSAPYNRLPSDN